MVTTSNLYLNRPFFYFAIPSRFRLRWMATPLGLRQMPGKFSGYFVGGGKGYASFSLHTHIVHIVSGALYLGLCNLELEGIV